MTCRLSGAAVSFSDHMSNSSFHHFCELVCPSVTSCGEFSAAALSRLSSVAVRQYFQIELLFDFAKHSDVVDSLCWTRIKGGEQREKRSEASFSFLLRNFLFNHFSELVVG